MDRKLKLGLGILGGWAGLVLLSKAAQPSAPVIGPDPATRPKDLPPPNVKPPTPSDGKAPPPPVSTSSYLKELTPVGKASVYRMLDDHDAITTIRPNIFLVDPAVTESGMGRMNGTIALKTSQSPSAYVLLLSDVDGASVWFAAPSDLAALAADPKNEWVVYLRPGEYDAVKNASYKVDPASIPADVATSFAKALAAVRSKNVYPWEGTAA